MLRFFGNFRYRSKFDEELDDELRSHVRLRADHLEASGVQRAEAERQARIEFGGMERFKEEVRDSAVANVGDALSQDVKYAARLLTKSPAFTVIAVLTLALGVGANTAVFGLLNSLLLQPLPYAHPDRLVLLFEDNASKGIPMTGCSYPDLEALQSGKSLDGVAGVNRHALILTGRGEPAELDTVVVTPEIFPLLSVPPLRGRYLTQNDEGKGASPAVLLSEHVWRSRFGSDSNVVGRSITLDQKAFTVVGVMPANFRVPVFGERQDIWIPLAQDPLFSTFIPRRGGHWLRVVGRLKPGVSLAQYRSEAASISNALAKQFPDENGGWMVRAEPLHSAVVADIKAPLLVLSGASGLLLLLACVNIANLMLARATARVRELAVRRALGASRARVVRQLCTEGALLAIAGCLLGVVLTYSTIHLLPMLFPPDLPGMRELHVDARVLGFALLISLAATVIFALAPAALATGANLQLNLRDSGARSGSAPGSLRIRRFLAVAEIGLAAVLVVCAGLLVRSFFNITAIDFGFSPRNLVKAEISLPRYRYSKPDQWRAFARALLQRVHATPGLKDSALVVPAPLGDGFVDLGFSVPGHPPIARGMPGTAHYVAVSPGYFPVMRVPLLRGRAFNENDSEQSAKVTVISQTLADLYFRGEDPIGKALKFGFPPDPGVERTIVGIVGDVRDTNLTDRPGPMMYVPYIQEPLWGADLIVDSRLPETAVATSIRSVVRGIDPDLPVTGVMTMPEVIEAYVAQPRLHTLLLGGFGLTALLLAGLGVFGVLSYSVASRTREFGVRAALGASQKAIGNMILLEGVGLALGGLALGMIATTGAVRLLKTELYGVTSYDPVSFLASATILLALALLACFVPAWRAMKIDPAVALRNE